MAETQYSPSEHEAVASRTEPREWRFQDIGSVLYRRRWAGLLTFAAAATITVLYTVNTTPVFVARSQLLLGEKSNIVTFQGIDEQQDGERSYLETQQRLLRSRSLARRVIDELNLWNADAMKPGQSAAVGLLSLWKGRQPSTPATAAGATETRSESIAIDRMLSQLSVVPVRDTRIIEITYESSNPELAARIVNTLASAYIKQNLETRSQASKEAAAWLADQLAEQRRKVELSELALQKYRERENSLSLEAGQNIVVQRLNALNSAVTQAKTDLITVESLYRQLVAGQGERETLDTFPPIRSNTSVQEIRTRLANLQRERTELSRSLGAKHPDMVRVDLAITAARQELEAEVAKTVESIRREYLAAVAREKELAAALDKQKASALALSKQGIEYGVLLREVESNRQIYQSLLQRANETAVSSEVRGSSIQVVDAAEIPRSPVRPDKASYLLIGFLLSAVLGIIAALVREASDSRLQTPAAVKAALGLPFLGMVPYVSGRVLKGGSPLLTRGVPAAYGEAFRALRTNIIASAGARDRRSLLVTSAAPGDGKSVVAVNLAVAIGRSGSRVLLIDADLRRPVLHELLECQQRPGLSDVLTGARKPSEAIAKTRCSGVWLLPSGTGLSNPSEQLGSRRFKEFLEKLSESFDWIIVDSPPIMAVTDPAVIAQMTSGVLFVVNARRTQQRVAQAALDRLETAGGSFAGVVLNSVTLDRDEYYNTRYYLPFYGEYLSDKRSA
jgi:capsular exopolysaccharide synthesis family protein